MIKSILNIILLSLLLGCVESNAPLNEKSDKTPSKKDGCLSQFFYLDKDEHGIKNLEGKVLLLSLQEDSIYIEPEKVCSLHLTPYWEKKDFPDIVYNFPNLKYLWVAMRDFKKLPEGITELKYLEHLDLQNSGLEELPDNIGELSSLKTLTLLHSNVYSLPPSICNLHNLEKLHLGGTQIKRLPSCLGKLTNLKDFILFYEDGTRISKELKLEIDKLKNQLNTCNFHIRDESE